MPNTVLALDGRRPPNRNLARLACASVLALTLVLPAVPATAQLKPDAPSVQTPFGRAPLSFADVVERVKPAVVSIAVQNSARVAQNQKQQPNPRAPRGLPEGFPDLPDDHPLNEFFKNFRGGPNNPMPRPTQAQGSGFVISADGYVVTNNHVIDGGGKIQVVFDEQNKFEAEVVGTDSRTDLALLKIKGASRTFPFVKFAEKNPRVGDWALAVGNPFGLGGTVTAGIVSALARDIGSGPYDFMQIDAAVNRGNSGGPTFNLDGEVVGVNTAIYSPSGGNVGIAFAVPARTATEVITQLRQNGTVSRGWLGVKIENVDEDKAESLGLKAAKGALINEVTAGGPAADSGLKAGDTVVEINGEKINDSRDLARKIAAFAPNTKVDVKVWRNQKEQTVSIKLGLFPGQKELAKLEGSSKPSPATEMNRLGLSLAPASAQQNNREGVTIADVELGSDAEQKGIKTGDVILEVGGQTVDSAEDVNKNIDAAVKAGRNAVLLRLKSGEQIRFVGVRVKKS